MALKQSETITIKRSQISFAAYNPRKKDPKVIEALKRNFRKVGFLGGLVWNKTTGNLVGGHKRLETLDLIHGYNGTPETDYDVKVEMVELNLKTEKEQNIFLNNKNAQGQTDYFLLAEMIPEIDIEAAGLTTVDIEYIETIVPNFDFASNASLKQEINNIAPPAVKKPADKEHIKQQKELSKQQSTAVQSKTHFTVTFKSYEEKAEYLESLGINGDTTFVTSEKFLEAIS